MDIFKSFSKYGNPSKDIAKERLKLILVQDRANIPPQFLNRIKGDLIRVMSDYAEIDKEGIEITLNKNNVDCSKDENVSSLIANIPIKKVKNIGK